VEAQDDGIHYGESGKQDHRNLPMIKEDQHCQSHMPVPI
jgi:hypothetical protein